MLNLEVRSSCLFRALFASVTFLAFNDIDKSITFAQGGIRNKRSSLNNLVIM